MANWIKYGIDPGVMSRKPRGVSTRDWALSNASQDFRARYSRAGAPTKHSGDTLVRSFLYDTNPFVSFFKPTTHPLDAFITKWNYKYADFDNNYGPQCMDIVQYYNRDVNKAPFLVGPNAVDVYTTYPKTAYTRIAFAPGLVPLKGDIVIWGLGLGPYGHIAIFQSGNTSRFSSFDQNFPLNSRCHVQDHSYYAVLGWLRIK